VTALARKEQSLVWDEQEARSSLQTERATVARLRSWYSELEVSEHQNGINVTRLRVEAAQEQSSSSRLREEGREYKYAEAQLQGLQRVRGQFAMTEERLLRFERQEVDEVRKLRATMQQLESDADARYQRIAAKQTLEADLVRHTRDALHRTEWQADRLRASAPNQDALMTEFLFFKSESREMDTMKAEVSREKFAMHQAEADTAKLRAAESTVLQSALAEVRSTAARGATEKRQADAMAAQIRLYRAHAQNNQLEVDELTRALRDQGAAYGSPSRGAGSTDPWRSMEAPTTLTPRPDLRQAPLDIRLTPPLDSAGATPQHFDFGGLAPSPRSSTRADELRVQAEELRQEMARYQTRLRPG